MIVYPDNWRDVGQPISLQKIENTILEILSEIPCASLSLSGGVDSCLLLYYLQKVKKLVVAFTMGKTLDHPDVVYSKIAIEKISKNVKHEIYIPNKEDVESQHKGNVYGIFYKFVSKFTNRMISGDGVDEFNCGYYPHQKNPTESECSYFLSRLVPDHLVPLNEESGDVKVYLPYIDERLIMLWSQIPILDKVDKENRKKIIMLLAKDKMPQSILDRWKYGFCDSLNIKEKKNESNT